KKDLYVWRAIFKLYMEAAVFGKAASVHLKTYHSAKVRFEQFQADVTRLMADKNFTMPQSKAALCQFYDINLILLHLVHFQSLNHMAMTKILKKHDKRSGLSATIAFSRFAEKTLLCVENLSTLLLAAVHTQLLTIVPQPDDYLCPVCFAIAWRPIRLECSHVFCVRCIIKAHRQRLLDCPLCRQAHAVQHADATYLDKHLQDFMLLYFPKK
ncbi:hypothetical protein BDF14DRAFT_1685015, partial [Spinellus fusiger]